MKGTRCIYFQHDTETEIGQISSLFAEEEPFNREAPQFGHILEHGAGEAA
jgi:hypothetical protein